MSIIARHVMMHKEQRCQSYYPPRRNAVYQTCLGQSASNIALIICLGSVLSPQMIQKDSDGNMQSHCKYRTSA